MRTFVISDAHGYPELIKNALDHAGFQPGKDAFVYAGDLLDRGPDPEGCIELVDLHATEVLLGNHEVGVLLDFAVYPRTPESSACRQVLFDRVLNADPGIAWKAAACVEGVLVTHAGVSTQYERLFREECQGDPALLAARLNASLLAAIRRELETGYREEDGILGDDGPTWFRPPPYSDLPPLLGLRQVVGHTPPLPRLEQAGFHMVDPCVWLGMEDLGRFRYAVIEGGQVCVEEGTLTPIPSEEMDNDLEEALCC
jgi:Calcineurin-like phosphoesterase